MTNCPLPLTYPHLPDTFTGNRVGVESAVGLESASDLVFVDGVFCEHQASVRQTMNSRTEFSQRNFMRGIVTLERTEFNKRSGETNLISSSGRVRCRHEMQTGP